MPPTPELRPAVKAVPVPVLPARPSAFRTLPVPEMARSALTPVLIFRLPLLVIDELVWPVAVVRVAVTAGVAGGLDAGGKIDRLQHVGDGAALQVDRGIAAAVGHDVAG